MDVVCSEFVLQFKKNFSHLKDKRIVLYGIGYRTGALIECLKDEYNFIGLMDKEESNIGKIMFDRQILDIETVIKHADCIIIISVSFYDVIFNRISYLNLEHGIDIYFPNGEKAGLSEKEYEEFDIEYKKLNTKRVKEIIQENDVISFDLFDTLLIRKVLDPDVVFEVIDFRLQKRGLSFFNNRKEAYLDACKDGIPSLDSIYCKFQLLTGMTEDELNKVKNIEIETEKKLLTIRKEVVELYQFAKEIGKEVYIITDMYLPSEILSSILAEHNIFCDKEKMLVSCEYQMDKESGNLWEVFKEKISSEKSILHIGDNLQYDIIGAKKYGIHALQILSAKDMMRHTVFNKMLKLDLSLWNKLTLGLVAEKLFNSPFVENRIDEKSRVVLEKEQEVGYVGYGCLIRAYLGYIIQHAYEMHIEKLAFCARDGYLLKKDFDELMKMAESKSIESRYLKISRQIVRRAALFDVEAILDFASLPYRGSVKDYYKQRFGLDLESGKDKSELEIPRDSYLTESLLHQHEAAILEKSADLRRDYSNYLNKEIGEWNRTALVDFGFSGSTQYYLSQILQKPLTGFYLLADMNEDNQYNTRQEKLSYIYNQDDPGGGNSLMGKMFLVIESVFTAPYGTYLSCDDKGNFETAEKTSNNIMFLVKEKINDGILEFFRDCQDLLGDDIAELDFRDEIGVELLALVFKQEGVKITKNILDTFYSDDVLRYKTDRKIFD